MYTVYTVYYTAISVMSTMRTSRDLVPKGMQAADVSPLLGHLMGAGLNGAIARCPRPKRSIPLPAKPTDSSWQASRRTSRVGANFAADP